MNAALVTVLTVNSVAIVIISITVGYIIKGIRTIKRNGK